MSHKKEDVHVVIVGAGIGGIATGIALKSKLNFTNFTIYEMASGVGGTWRDNTYPGCACDIPSHWYSLSTELNPDWSKTWSLQPEILSYWQSLVKKHKLETHIQFNTKVENSVWDSELQVYNITVKNVQSGRTQNVIARVLISAIGGLVDPSFPPESELPGRSTFKGDMWHSARWNHKVDLKGKRVAVIGNGCSAAQFVPQISKDPSTTVVNFCRTPSWFVPQPQKLYSSVERWIFKHVPLAMRIYRTLLATRLDIFFILLWPKKSFARNYLRKSLETYIKKKAPVDYHEKLIPNYPPGCKRIVLDPGYLKCLRQPNVTLNWDGIERLTENGIVTKKGEEFNFDVVIFGTGFAVANSRLNLAGTNGLQLKEYWESVGGPTAYLGTTIPGFPNYFIIFGPNTATGHASVIFSEESQINYAMRLIKPILAGKVQSFEVRAEATDAYNDDIQRRLNTTVWVDCISWYRAGGNKGKVIATYPGPITKFWWSTLVPKWVDYKAYGSKDWNPSGSFIGLIKAFLVL